MKSAGAFVRTIVFGITDSLVSTVGLLAGIDVSGAPHQIIALTGLVYAFVEAFSMAVGNFLSEKSAEEYATKAAVPDRAPAALGVVMFVAFVLASFIPLAPYLLLGDPYALYVSIAVSIIALAIAGAIAALFSRLPVVSRALRMVLLGGAAIILGALVGYFFRAA